MSHINHIHGPFFSQVIYALKMHSYNNALLFIYITLQLNLPPFFCVFRGAFAYNLSLLSGWCWWAFTELTAAHLFSLETRLYCLSNRTHLLFGQGRQTALTDRGNCLKLTCLDIMAMYPLLKLCPCPNNFWKRTQAFGWLTVNDYAF